MSNLPIQTKPSRVWFLNQGCAKVPPELTGGKVLYAHPHGYFLGAYGTEQKPTFSPYTRTPGRGCHNGKRGRSYPDMRNYGHGACHRLMAYAFAKEPCPTFYYKSGKPYKGIVHHLIEDPEDFRLDNLLFWLSHPQHTEADRRQRALRALCPNGNLRVFTYERLRQLQDPRRMTKVEFEFELVKLKKCFENMVIVNGIDACAEERRKYA